MNAETEDEASLRADLVRWGKSIFDRGLTNGTSGNLSVRLPGGDLLVTPTGACLGFLSAARLSRLSPQGRHLAGDAPTKEVPIHLAWYHARPDTGAVVHVHSTHATALSILSDTDPHDALPPLTAYAVMRLGRVPLLPWLPPGDSGLGDQIAAHAGACTAVLLANHGPVVAGRDLNAAVAAAEELEETARLALLLRGLPVRLISEPERAELIRRFGDLGKSVR